MLSAIGIDIQYWHVERFVSLAANIEAKRNLANIEVPKTLQASLIGLGNVTRQTSRRLSQWVGARENGKQICISWTNEETEETFGWKMLENSLNVIAYLDLVFWFVCLSKTETTLNSTSNARNVTLWQHLFCIAVCQLPQSHNNHMEMQQTKEMWMSGEKNIAIREAPL